MRVVTAHPHQAARVDDLAPDLASLQAAVQGYLELWAVDDHVRCLCNEEGRLNGMPFNRSVILRDGTLWRIYGPIVIVGGNADTGEFESLTPGEALFWQTLLNDGQELF